MDIAAVAGNALVRAAVTDAWEDVRHKVARIFGHGAPDTQIEKKFDATRAALEAAIWPDDAEKAIADEAASWTARLRVLLADHPDASAELDVLVNEINTSAHVASDHSIAAGRYVSITASSSGVAAGVINGDVGTGPTRPGPAAS